MNLTVVNIDYKAYPKSIQNFIKNSKVYDSSSSPEAKVIFIDKDGGYFLKTACKGTLRKEAEMTAYFNKLGLSAAVLEYWSGEEDFLLTNKIKGEDCTCLDYLNNPEKLCDLMAENLYKLHTTSYIGCPVMNRTGEYLRTAEHNYLRGVFDLSFISDRLNFTAPDDVWRFVKANESVLKTDTLIHGDYCLPNIIFNDWKFSGFIDLGNGGVGDRHIDLFWGAWTLRYNLKTDKYRDRFYDAYGRQNINEEVIDYISAVECFG